MSDFDNKNNPDLTGSNDSNYNPQPPQGSEQPTYGNQPPQYTNPGPEYGQQAPYGSQPYGQQPSYSGNPQYTDPNQQYADPNQQYTDPNQQYGAPNQQYNQPPYNGQPFQQTINIQTPPPVYVNQKSKLAAGLLGIFLGSIGVHNFYLGYTGKAVAQLLIALLTCGAGAVITGIWGLIEGIMILTGSIAVDGQGIPLSE